MKLRRSMPAMLLCSALLLAVGLIGCGDDDDEVNCGQALAEILVPACVDGVTAGIDDFRDCLAACGDPACEDGCEADLNAAVAPCEPAASILDEDCGCQVCGNNFDICVGSATPAAQCVEEMIGCLTDCVTL